MMHLLAMAADEKWPAPRTQSAKPENQDDLKKISSSA